MAMPTTSMKKNHRLALTRGQVVDDAIADVGEFADDVAHVFLAGSSYCVVTAASSWLPSPRAVVPMKAR